MTDTHMPPSATPSTESRTPILALDDVTKVYGTHVALSHMTLSVYAGEVTCVLGDNGAGKSTLIKMLTGETIPTTGRVEKHPNLRIGYIKQHALEHVEMHLEKTPNQYLQWRYANGDDREVHMKQTRILSDQDRAQMETTVDMGDGSGPRQIETLVGRQKWKKSFQYEM